jgi:hypothetical protein
VLTGGDCDRYANDEDDVRAAAPHPTARGLRVVEEQVVGEDGDEGAASTRPSKRPADDGGGMDEQDDAGEEEEEEEAGAKPPLKSKWVRVAEEAARVRMDALAPEPAAPAPATAPLEAGALPADFYDAAPSLGTAAAVDAKKRDKRKADAGEEDGVDAGEWERFRRTIHRESVVSAQLQEADLVEMMQGRDERLEYEQTQLQDRVAALRARKDALGRAPPRPSPAATATAAAADEDDDDEDEEDVDPDDVLFDWRAKGV